MNGRYAAHPVDGEMVVCFDSVSFAYGPLTVLENVSFHIHRGEFIALVGPNGSGKTTALKLLLGLERPASGRILRFGVAGESGTAWRGRLGYVPQQPPQDRAFPVSVREVVRMGLLHRSRRYAAGVQAAVDEALAQTGMAALADRQWRSLSGGQRRRALVARALAARPALLVLDEPAANLDAESEARLWETLGGLKGRTTILIVTHDMEFVSSLTSRVLCLGGERHAHRVVQHPLAPEEASSSGGGDERGLRGARVLHGEDMPADGCCGEEGGEVG
jgi:zinc transport system ATP-binding protein